MADCYCVSPLGDGMCVYYGSVGKAIDSGVWFSRQPVPTQGQTGRENRLQLIGKAIIDTSNRQIM